MDREALKAERAELVRRADKRRGRPGYGANVEALERMIADIDAQLAQPDEPVTPVVSLAGKALRDPDASPREKSLAASVLSQSDEGDSSPN